MSSKWKLGSLETGSITIAELNTDKGKASVDIRSTGSASTAVDMLTLPSAVRTNWESRFAPNENILVLDNPDLPWNSSRAIAWAGYIDKVRSDLTETTLNVQAVEIGEYLKARYVIDVWDKKVTNPEESIIFEGAGWTGVIASIISKAFSSTGIPTDAPRPPQVLGEINGSESLAIRKKTVLKTDGITYYDLLTEIMESDSTDGREYRFRPRWASSARNRVVWDVFIGTKAAPHLNENLSVSIALKEDPTWRFSGFEVSLVGTEAYTKLNMQSKQGSIAEEGKEDEAEPADLAAGYKSGAKVLFEDFFSPGVELNEQQFAEQMTARISKGGKASKEIDMSFEENVRPSDAIEDLGKTIHLTGVEGTKSEGFSANVRCVALSWTPGTSTVSYEVVSPQPSYPRLPRERKRGLGTKEKPKKKGLGKPASFKMGGTDVPPTDPWTGPGTGPTSPLGPGGDFGSGGMTSKTDSGPYKVAAVARYDHTWTEMSQSIGNIAFYFTSTTNGVETGRVEYQWGEEYVGTETAQNASYKAGTLLMGSFYGDHGSIAGAELRFDLNANALANIFINNRQSYGFFDPIGKDVLNGVGGLTITAHPVVIRDYVYIALSVNMYGHGHYAPSFQRTIFGRMRINAWNSLHPLELMNHDAHLPGLLQGSPTRTGDWLIVSTSNGVLTANVGANNGLIPEGGWTPAAPSISGSMVIAKMHDSNELTSQKNWYLCSGVFRIRLLDGGQPIAGSQESWERFTPYLGTPENHESPGVEPTFYITNFGGWPLLWASFRSTEGYRNTNEFVFFEDDSGDWHRDDSHTFSQVYGPYPIQPASMGYEEWLYGPRNAIQIIRAAEWADTQAAGGAA